MVLVKGALGTCEKLSHNFIRLDTHATCAVKFSATEINAQFLVLWLVRLFCGDGVPKNLVLNRVPSFFAILALLAAFVLLFRHFLLDLLLSLAS